MNYYQPEPFMLGGGFPQWGGYAPQYQQQAQPQQMTGAQRGDARLQKLTGRIGDLQEQYKGAGTEQQAGIQNRIGKLQGRAKGLRQDRRRGQGLYQPQTAQGGQPEPMQLPQGGAGYGGYGGWGMSPWGGYRPQTSTMGAPQGQQGAGRQQSAQSQGGPAQNPGSGFNPAPMGNTWQGAWEAGDYQTPFGNLVQSNSGQGFLAKQNNGGDQQYGFNGQSWQAATPDNMGSFVDPYQYAQQAGASRANYQLQGGMYRPQAGFGTYR